MKKQLSIQALFELLLLFILFFGPLIGISGHRNTNKFSPPVTGDWIISGNESLSDTALLMKGSIYIQSGGSLELDNVDLTFAIDAEGAVNGEFNLTVEEGGTLQIINSSITTDHESKYTYLEFQKTMSVNSSILIQNTVISQIGHSAKYGINIQANGTEIRDSTIISNYISNGITINIQECKDVSIQNNYINHSLGLLSYGILVNNAENSFISNNTIHIHSPTYTIYVVDSPFLHIKDNTFVSFIESIHIFMGNNCSYSLIDNNVFITPVDNYAIYMEYGVTSVQDVIISNNNINVGIARGIYGYKTANLTIINNVFNGTRENLWLEDHMDGNLIIHDNFFHSFNQVSVLIDSLYDGSGPSPSISNNIFNYSANAAMKITGLDKVKIDNNQINEVASLSEDVGALKISKCDNAILSNNMITNTEYSGIELVKSDNCVIQNNQLSKIDLIGQDGYGINATNCDNLTIASNTINKIGNIGIKFDSTGDWLSVNIYDNVVKNTYKEGMYVKKATSGVIMDNTISKTKYTALYLFNSTDLHIENMVIEYSQLYGINGVTYLNNITITGSTISNCYYYAIRLTSPNNSVISDNHLYDNYRGIYLGVGHFTQIKNNYVHNCNDGMYFMGLGTNLVISNNVIENNIRAIYFNSLDSIIKNNTIANNYYGLHMGISSTNNLIYYNDFLGNSIQGYDVTTPADNEWSFYSGIEDKYYGNYYDDYTGIDVAVPIGFGDTPYALVCPGDDIFDEYPLMKQGTEIDPPTINHPSDISYYNDSTAVHYVVWNVVSLYGPSEYKIKLNGSTVKTGTINEKSETIIYQISDSLEPANYTTTCTVTNYYGVAVTDTVNLSILNATETQETQTENGDETTPPPAEDGIFENFDYTTAGIGAGAGIVLTGAIAGVIGLATRGKGSSSSSKDSSKRSSKSKGKSKK